VRRGQGGAVDAGADGLADTELLPQPAGNQHDAEVEDGVDLDLRNGGLAAGRQSIGGIGVDDALDAGDQALQGGAVELVGAAEAVHHPRFGALGLGVPEVLGEGVVGDAGAVTVMPLSDAQIHASSIERFGNFGNA